MLQLSGKKPTLVTSFCKEWQHRGELLSFDPSENLENSKYKGEKFESCFSCSSIVRARSAMEPVQLYTYRCEPFSFLLIRVFQDLQTKNVKKAHTHCAYI